MADAARVGVVSSHQLQFKISEVVDTDTVGTGMRSGDETGPVPLSSYKTILPTDITQITDISEILYLNELSLTGYGNSDDISMKIVMNDDDIRINYPINV